jgi:hypothetical protein
MRKKSDFEFLVFLVLYYIKKACVNILWQFMEPGSHVGYQISTKNTNLVENHPMNISGKLGSILFSGFRGEDLNVKS